MSLQSDIDDALKASSEFKWSNWGVPDLSAPRVTGAVMTRYGGRSPINARARTVVEVALLWSTTADPEAYLGLDDAVEALLDLLYGVNNAYPELLPVDAIHDWTPVKGGRNTYVGAMLRVCDAG